MHRQKREKHKLGLLWFASSPYINVERRMFKLITEKKNSINMPELARVVVGCPISEAKSFPLLQLVSLSPGFTSCFQSHLCPEMQANEIQCSL